ncbi:flagellar basal body L-ring protein FlgH [Paracraurococcus lichenis]|uniref:Flagellar L-ring protein n=1 Tax=Paracraurococcus lichenis TaxID=3064888 RepID=A0ABT9EAS8_9PROT|nr:flagellar basal body L-ring protein FlgH [Paracraurococcus sp. LOR1-02]MDO9713025.1 flagellar basal body L-ring protein FlgH [Paracraurococcus sp. LOR1-02]
MRFSSCRGLALGAALLALPACDTLSHFQKPPTITAPGEIASVPPPGPVDPPLEAAMRPGEVVPEARMAGSLWRAGSRTFFRDQRARAVGDLLTVEIEIDHIAQFDNQTRLGRDNAQSLSSPALFGFQGILSRLVRPIAGGSTTPGSVVDVSSNSTANGTGQIRREEKIKLQVAATVVRRLPSGNLEIAGSQEIRVNNELREIGVRGIIRPEDIQATNRIASDKIAEARVSYGGRGVASDLQRPRWGGQVFERILPF